MRCFFFDRFASSRLKVVLNFPIYLVARIRSPMLHIGDIILARFDNQRRRYNRVRRRATRRADVLIITSSARSLARSLARMRVRVCIFNMVPARELASQQCSTARRAHGAKKARRRTAARIPCVDRLSSTILLTNRGNAM